MRKWQRELYTISILLGISVLLYVAHYLLFHDLYHIAIYFVGDLAFLGVNALVVYFVIDRLMKSREKEASLKKLNMLAGIFFYDLGLKVLNVLNTMLKDAPQCANHICVQQPWREQDFRAARKRLRTLPLAFTYKPEKVEELAEVVRSGKELIIRLMENPTLHEHEVFSDTLLALFHLTEEVLRRDTLRDNAFDDKEHLLNDIKRLYIYLVQLWLEYMQHLKDNYAYLYKYNINNRQIKFA